jgi:predicted RNA-binding Zn-ribbon protein involved in translation (DUF1610 family)
VANEWREHAMLKGRFLPDYPDDLQVVVHDGGPQITRNEPEMVWVTVTRMDGDLFWGHVLNQPHNLQTVHQGDEIKFVVPDGNAPAALVELAANRLGLHQPALRGWLAPILATDKYLREREAWIIHPCPQCGLSELFDAPSDLIRMVFPHPPPDAEMRSFTATCPQCGGVQCVESRRSPAAGGAEPVRASSNQDGKYLETAMSLVENMTEIGALLRTITDDASADVVLPKLDKAIVRHNDLSKKIESYKMSMADHVKLAQEQYKEYLATTSDMTVSAAAAQANAAFAQSNAQGKARDIEAAMKKIGLA